MHHLLNMLVCKTFLKYQRLLPSLCLNTVRLVSTYEGEGKTYVTILNKEEDTGILVNAISPLGFRLNNDMTILGPCVLFPRSAVSWNVESAEKINRDSLSLLSLLQPKIDILVLGYGDKQNFSPSLEKVIHDFKLKNSIAIEVLPTEDACAAYNFLNCERRAVAGAMIPVQTLKIYDDDDLLIRKEELQ